MDFTAGVLARVVVCAGVTIVATLVVWILERNDRPHFGMLVSFASSMVVGTLLAIFMGVLSMISAFREMAVRGGGIASAAAGIWEGTQPIRLALYAGVVAGLFALISVLTQESDDREGTNAGRAGVLVILFIVVISLAAVSFLFYNHVTETVVLVLDPAEHYREIAPATMSERISRALMRTTFTSLTGLVFTLVAIPIGLVIGRPVSLSSLLQKMTLFVLALLTLFVLMGAFMMTSSSTRLKQIALTGSVPR